MRKTAKTLLFLTAAISLPVLAQNAAVVNGKPVPASHVNAIVSEVVSQGQQDTPQLRATVRENLIMREILVQEAEKKKLAASPEVKTQLEVTRRNILVRALMSDFVAKNPVSDAEIAKEYEQIKAQSGSTEYHAFHILVKTEEEAGAIMEQLKNGSDFEKLAKEKSIDSTAAKGGDLGWAAPNVYVDAFAQALVQLKKGEYSTTPVKSSFGYHVIMLKDTRPLKFPELSEIRPGLVQAIQEKKWAAYAQNLRNSAKIK